MCAFCLLISFIKSLPAIQGELFGAGNISEEVILYAVYDVRLRVPENG